MTRHQNLVYSVAVRLLGNETDAADIAQEVFLKAYDRFAMLEENPAAPGWLRTVTTNLCLNHLTRYRARWRFFSEFQTDDHSTSLEESLPAAPQQEGNDEQEFRRQYLEAALQKLPSSQRVPLVLYHFEEMSYDAIAAKLNISLSKVKTDIHRARESLRRWLRPDLHGGEETVWMKPAPEQTLPPAQNQSLAGSRWLNLICDRLSPFPGT